jgi:hypothetical protein
MPELLCHIGREARTGYDYIRIVSYPKREGGALLRAISANTPAINDADQGKQKFVWAGDFSRL